jgi:hypothetical protein
VLGFNTGFVVIYNLKRLVVMSPPQIAKFYFFRGTFIWDLLSALPVIAEVGSRSEKRNSNVLPVTPAASSTISKITKEQDKVLGSANRPIILPLTNKLIVLWSLLKEKSGPFWVGMG